MIQAWAPVGMHKYHSFMEYVQLYPEYDFIFLGDNGQGDAMCADRVIEKAGEPSVTGQIAIGPASTLLCLSCLPCLRFDALQEHTDFTPFQSVASEQAPMDGALLDCLFNFWDDWYQASRAWSCLLNLVCAGGLLPSSDSLTHTHVQSRVM